MTFSGFESLKNLTPDNNYPTIPVWYGFGDAPTHVTNWMPAAAVHLLTRPISTTLS